MAGDAIFELEKKGSERGTALLESAFSSYMTTDFCCYSFVCDIVYDTAARVESEPDFEERKAIALAIREQLEVAIERLDAI